MKSLLNHPLVMMRVAEKRISFAIVLSKLLFFRFALCCRFV